MPIEMQTTYVHPEGDLAIFQPNGNVELELRHETRPGQSTSDHVSFAKALPLAGQEVGVEGAIESLKGCVVASIASSLNVGVARGLMFPAPWVESQRTQEEIDTLRAEFRKKHANIISLVVTKQDIDSFEQLEEQ